MPSSSFRELKDSIKLILRSVRKDNELRPLVLRPVSLPAFVVMEKCIRSSLVLALRFHTF